MMDAREDCERGEEVPLRPPAGPLCPELSAEGSSGHGLPTLRSLTAADALLADCVDLHRILGMIDVGVKALLDLAQKSHDTRNPAQQSLEEHPQHPAHHSPNIPKYMRH